MSSVSNAAGFDRKEPLPGYKVVELLGRGGSGEVWRANAPGGLAKAVKIVYGDADPSQAATEMRSLSRMKDVRHPLLLSIERIEVVFGNLVIVTELADCSLKQYFAKCREAGSPGVPQAELVRHIDDVAQVLDFLYERYSLQHLDVKPENILLVSGRAKVGDFGLVKNLYERSASLVGGLTPTYAPPELFEGKPNRHSDQYSLALVYMQMLTGVSPFTASNMAQLAAQHMRAAPELSALPKRQRPVIARALSKDPAQRFETCVAMVEALKDAIRDADRAVEPVAMQRTETIAGETAAKLPVPREPAIRPTRESPSGILRTAPQPERKPAGTDDASASAPRAARANGQPPVVFVGVGSAGVEVLAKLVNRLRDRFGRTESWPAVEMLVLDSNTKTLTSQFREDDLARIQVVPIPLKSAESYGAQADHFVRWLGRRWFYNIPRDLTTGGYRPLGRLALLTHASRVREAVSSVIARAGNHAAPRVVVVGSISGGTGSGALIDLTYALRSELKRRGFPDDEVHGILLHATPRGNADRDKARANAYAALCELHHFSRPGGNYPGESLLQAPPFHGDNATFGRMHLLNLGNGLGPAEWDLATDQIAEFVYATSFTAVRRILDGQSGEDGKAWPACVQPYDVLALGAGSSRLVDQWVRIACNDVIQALREGRQAAVNAASNQESSRTLTINVASVVSAAKAQELEPEIVRRLSDARLRSDDLLVDAAEVLDLEVEGSEKFVERLTDEALTATKAQTDVPARVDSILKLLDQVLECDIAGNVDDSQEMLYGRIVSRLIVRTHGGLDGLVSWIKGLVELPEMRIEGARQMCATTQAILQSSQERLVVQAVELHETAVATGRAAHDPESLKADRSGLVGWALGRSNPDHKLREVIKQYTTGRLNELLARVAAKILRIVHAELTNVTEHLNRLCRDLSLLAEPVRAAEQCLPDVDAKSGTAMALAGFWQLMLVELERGRGETARKTEAALERRLSERQLGLRRFLDPGSEVRREIWQPLSEVARQEVLKRVREISCQLIAANPERGTTDLVSLVAAAVRSEPRTGASEVMGRVLILPEETDAPHLPRRVQSALPDTLVVHDKRCDVTLCSIRHPATLDQVAHDVIAGNDQYKELATRLHTRADLRWQPLTATPQAPQRQEPAEVTEECPTKTVALRV